MRVLILGSDTPLGRSLQDFLVATGRHELVLLTRSSCRWRSERQAKKVVQRADCQVLVDVRISAGIDSGEELPGQDVERCHWLGKACQRNEINYLYLSSDRLFSGNMDRFYSEDDYPDSDDTPGRMLLQAENAVRDRCESHLILRLGPVFSHRDGNWFAQLIDQLESGGALVLSDHVRGSPVAAYDAARVVSALLDQLSAGAQPWGIYHYCSADKFNPRELVDAVLATSSQYSDLDARQVSLDPAPEQQAGINRALDCSKIKNTFAIKQDRWREYVGETVKLYFEQSQ